MYTYELSNEKPNIVDPEYIIDPYQLKHAAQASPDRHFSPPVDFLFRNHYSIPLILLRWNVSARISLRGQRKLICSDTLRRVNNVGFLLERLIFICD